MAVIQQGFPQLSSPIADANNSLRVTQPWQQFFISLWNRTGATQGNATFDPGDMKAIAGVSIPAGWLLCDGSAVSRTQFVALFNSIGVLWGNGDNVTTFNVPDLKTRSPIGTSDLFPLGSIGGNTTITLGLSNLPAHNHGVLDPGHTHTSLVAASNVTSGTDSGGTVAGNTGISTTGISTTNTGSGTPFSTMSPYAAVQWIIKT